MTLQTLAYHAEEVGAQVACFGHSHVLGAELLDGILFINPGSILLPRSRVEKTFALLEMDENHIEVRFEDIRWTAAWNKQFLKEDKKNYPLLKSVVFISSYEYNKYCR